MIVRCILVTRYYTHVQKVTSNWPPPLFALPTPLPRFSIVICVDSEKMTLLEFVDMYLLVLGIFLKLPKHILQGFSRLPSCYDLRSGSTAGGCAGAAGGSLVAMTSNSEVPGRLCRSCRQILIKFDQIFTTPVKNHRIHVQNIQESHFPK